MLIVGFDSNLQNQIVLCPNGHKLIGSKKNQQIQDCWSCANSACVGGHNGKAKKHREMSNVHCSEGCNFVLCVLCLKKYRKSSTNNELRCSKDHMMVHYTARQRNDKNKWRCNFQPQGACLAGIGGEEYMTHKHRDVWRCNEYGKNCESLELCGTCANSIIAKIVSYGKQT